MRTGSIEIGGKPYAVEGLTVRESMKVDMILQKAREDKNEDQQINTRLLRVALALKKGNSFIQDPANPKGELLAGTLSTDQIVAFLDSGAFTGMAEWYKAEVDVMKLNGVIIPDQKKDDKPVGETKAES